MGKTDDSEKAIRDIIRLAEYTEITHHTPGRVRLKYSLWGLKAASNIDFEDLVRRIPGLLDADVRLLSRTIIINYAPELLPGDLWEDLQRIKKKPELANVVAARIKDLMERENRA
jgi:hypothetical protein